MTDDHTGPDELTPAVDLTLRAAVLELEKHAAASGWDQAAQLYALVPAGDVVGADPQAAEIVGLPADVDPETLVTDRAGRPARRPVAGAAARPDRVARGGARHRGRGGAAGAAAVGG